MLIEPHGGQLVNRIVPEDKQAQLLAAAENMPQINLSNRELTEVENIATGLYSPLTGFMNQKDYQHVIEDMQLANGLPWTIPVVLGVSEAQAKSLTIGQDIALTAGQEVYAILHLEDKYKYDKKQEAKLVYQTTEKEHPGVKKLYQRDNILLGGKISLLKKIDHHRFRHYRLEPSGVREMIKEKGWERVVGFQTRNPIHRAHEYIQKCALEICDGLLLTPLVGETKSSDVPVEYRIESYEVVMDKIYPQDRMALTVFPAPMRYAGPREAIFHALCRKNLGCTHFIVGRDHAGVGDYYGTYEAQELFDQFDSDKLGIAPLCFDYSFYCKECNSMATKKTCPHDSDFHISLSGTKVRGMLRAGKKPPKELTRPEVAEVLVKGMAQ
ncbi:ATP sulfurylase [Halobacteroides halobius DSM 5150]|uniref:Sulfate adenylyltransferase n=1 Tax=Halobacteroides halobius (strain ATCC 35273 / DSM 5150 / MD-1) TaxID=748449 RepID=L0KDQ5_HALHC|nr:sulfate adenylyltransferase [Halobacteroides halobius]AGB42213.1 ATP sulfurylase [Halobacteroides halobius DSM 5150]